jgi:hypothetical protein
MKALGACSAHDSGKPARSEVRPIGARRSDFTCHAAGVLSGAFGSRLHPNRGAAVPQTPVRNAEHPDDPAHRHALSKPPQPSPDVRLPPAAPPIADNNERALGGVTRVRLCILCGHPLRTGQHMLRVHGSTIHARCNNTRR